MKELLAPHWLIGGLLSLGGGLAYRFGDRVLVGHGLIACKFAGLFFLATGLFVVMRGVSREAQKRPALDETEAVRRIPQLRRPRDDKK